MRKSSPPRHKLPLLLLFLSFASFGVYASDPPKNTGTATPPVWIKPGIDWFDSKPVIRDQVINHGACAFHPLAGFGVKEHRTPHVNYFAQLFKRQIVSVDAQFVHCELGLQ